MAFFTKEGAQRFLKSADIKVDGGRPWDMTIHDERIYRRIAFGGSLALGESYMDGWWDCPALDQFFYHVAKGGLAKTAPGAGRVVRRVLEGIVNPQSKRRAFIIGEEHYDLGNDLYVAMLDKRMVYTCAYWKDAKNLDEAQEAKLDLVCRKLGLKPGDTVLDIGCGWGSFAKFAAEKYGAHVVGVTVSKEQAALARENCAGLPVEIRLEDYRDTVGEFDHIVSLGMMEHVGHKNYGTYIKKAHSLLKDGGFFLLHTIGGNESEQTGDSWVNKYIFPNSMLPSITQIGRHLERRFVMEDWHNFGADYDKTLMAWHSNFINNWDKLKGKYDDRFKRMWVYYLLLFAGFFRSRNLQLWQIVLSKRGVPGGYTSVR